MADLQNARIPQLPPAATAQPAMLFPIYDPVDDTTKRIPASFFLVSGTTGNFEWLTDTAYLEDAVVTRSGIWWQAQQDVPANIVPGTDPAYWLAIPKSASGFVFWAAGAFTEDEVFVLRSLDQFIQIFRLTNATRPYVSANFEEEYAAGDWELMSERGYVGIFKNAHGWPLNTLLTYKSGAWNTFTTGDTPLAIVRNVVSVNAVIVVLLGARLKGLTGLTAGSTYYGQSDGTISTTPSDNAVFLAVSATEAILFAGGTGGHVFFKGVFANEAALDAAFPTAEPGDYALVDTGGTEAELYIWDDTDTDWLPSGVTTIVPDASETVKGIIELATQAEANTGTDDLKATTPLKLKTKVALRSVKTAAYSILATDDQTEITFDLPSDDNITIVPMATDYMIGVSNIGAGQLNFVGSGVTLLGATSLAGGVVSGAYIRFVSATVAYVMCANNVTWGQISSRPTTVNGFVITDTISILNSQFTSVGNVGAGEDTLHTYTVPGGTLTANGQTITAYAAGTFAATANNKRLRVKWGATTIFDSGALVVTVASSWVLEIRIMRTGAATQRCCVSLVSSDAAVTINASYATATETLTSGSALSVTGEATSDNDIVEEIFKVRKEGV